MDLEKFKHVNETKRMEWDKRVDKYNRLKAYQEEHVTSAYNPIKKFKWLKLDYDYFCPLCDRKLDKNKLVRLEDRLGFTLAVYLLSCDKCGYEYVV